LLNSKAALLPLILGALTCHYLDNLPIAVEDFIPLTDLMRRDTVVNDNASMVIEITKKLYALGITQWSKTSAQ
jgi:hypothetical protein